MERYFSIRAEAEPLRIRPKGSVTVSFDGTGVKGAKRLHFTGETALFFQWKNEPDTPTLYRRIDDSLSVDKAWRDQYCLKMESDGTYPILAYHKMTFPPRLSYIATKNYTDRWTLGISVKGEDVRIPEGAYLRFRAEIRYKKPGVDVRSTKADADEIFDIDLPEGTYDWRELTREIEFHTKETASVALYLEGEGYTGTVYGEVPLFRGENGWNHAPAFAPNTDGRPQFTWTGVNLSHKEWVGLDVKLNGKTFYSDKLFERCHRKSEGEISLNGAEILPGENQLTFTLTSDYRDPLAYHLYDIGFVCEDDSFLVACPKIVTAGKPFAVIVDTEKDAKITLTSDRVRPLDLNCGEAGLNALLLQCDEAENGVEFTLEYQGKTEACTVERCVIREDDGVLTGTGDMVYVPNEEEAVKTYLKWYFGNQIGNFFTIRPTYRWCGTRSLDEALWKKTARLLNKAGMKYAHMLDGRELPGCDTNPSCEALAGPEFQGRQCHEHDGAQCYWGIWDLEKRGEEAFVDLFHRRNKTHGKHMGTTRANPVNLFEKDGKRVFFRDPTLPDDMEVRANFTVDQFRASKKDATRHTGPTTLFKYFYQAGFEWTGAELMYGPQETIAAALRGASKAYGRPTVGAHHAVQWSSTPHDTEARYYRYRLALFGSWMQGIHDINTEEGLWHIEELYSGFNRFSEACRNHTKQQTDFYRYVQTHARTGEHYTPVAFLSGRFDGWNVFGRKSCWGSPTMPMAEPEKAWMNLKYFYPRNKHGSLYRHPCPNESIGFYTGTPHGNVDIIPIEQGSFDAYPLLVAVGYNKALPEDFDKLQAYAERGGTLMLGWPQCAVTTLRTDVVSLNHQYIDHPFRKQIAPDGAFVADTYRGQPVTVGTAPAEGKILRKTDSGRPLVCEISVGTGRVIFINVKEYAAEGAAMALCQELLEEITPQFLAKEAVYGEGDENVQFVRYDQPDGAKHLYFMATDWYNDPDARREGTLIADGYRYTVPAPLGSPIKAVVKDGAAVWCNDWENDVLSVDGNSALLQGQGIAQYTVAKNGTVKTVTVDFSEKSLQTVEL